MGNAQIVLKNIQRHWTVNNVLIQLNIVKYIKMKKNVINVKINMDL